MVMWHSEPTRERVLCTLVETEWHQPWGIPPEPMLVADTKKSKLVVGPLLSSRAGKILEVGNVKLKQRGRQSERGRHQNNRFTKEN